MRRPLVVVIVLVVVLVALYLWSSRTDPSPGTAPALAGAPASADVLARGEYLTRAADCVACHTVAGAGRAFAGGVPFKLPFGTIYSTNITADRETGIGAWSDEEFVRAVRDGVAPGGRHLYPAFPYTSFTGLSRDDVLAIKSYLFSLDPVHAPARDNDLSFPFNQRWALGLWNAAFFHSGRFVVDSARPPTWNRGAYLARALGHCGECHTPRNFGYGLESTREFAGAELQGWHAYNITSDTQAGIGQWSETGLAAYLKSGHADGHGSASGPMGDAVERSLQYLDPEDIAALVAYVRSVPPQRGEHPIAVDPQPRPALASTAVGPGTADDATHAEGAALFAGACAGCHTWNGKGLETSYAALLGARTVNDPRGANLIEIVLGGSHLHVAANDVMMPGFGRGYSNLEIAALTNYVIGHFGNKTGEVRPEDVAQRRSL